MYKLSRLIALAAALLSSGALAHTQIIQLSPAMGSHVQAPVVIKMEFDEAVNLHFSTFKVYPLPAGHEAAQYAAAMLPAKGCDPLRADTCTNPTGLAARLSLPLRPGLKVGAYVVMWRILSDDGHVVTGQSTFFVKR